MKKSINIRIDEDIKKQAEILAKQENRSLKNFVETLLIERVMSSNLDHQEDKAMQREEQEESVLEKTKHKF